MNPLDKIPGWLKQWGTIMVVVSMLVSATLWAKDFKKSVNNVEQAQVKLAVLAERYEDPNNWLREMLLSCGINEKKVQYFMGHSLGTPPVDSSGKIIEGLPYISNENNWPFIGIFYKYSGDSLIVGDTAWNVIPCKDK